MHVSPIVRMHGEVHGATPRTVAAIAASPAQRDEQGRITRDAIEARASYDVYDVTILADGGGYAHVVMKAEHLIHLGSSIPARGDKVDWPIRTYIAWAGRANRRFPTVGFSVAGDQLAEEASRSKTSGARAAATAA